ncbi:hypothetical protein GQR58_009314 [Nymphon striatum]|nr:hypothetical protein GQR58_009314 [Nymphon striatum]
MFRTSLSSKFSKFQIDLENISQIIDTTMNLFVESLLPGTNLYCVADGKKASDKVKYDMLNLFVFGKKWKDEFVQGCFEDPTSFERPLQRREVSNFASSAIKSKIRGKDEKVVELKTTRDLMGRLVYLACTRNIELEKGFSFSTYPRSTLLGQHFWHSEEDAKVQTLQSLPTSLPHNFGKVAELVLKIICSTQADETHFVCDSYVKSIKNAEQQARGANDGSFNITGADQLRPKDFRYALRSPNFKTALIKFFMEEWKRNKYAAIIKRKIVVVAHENQCIQYTATQTGNVEHNEITKRQCVDGLGYSADNTRRYAHITTLANHIGPVLCKALPGYHALTGCDYTSSFFRKGKVNPLKKAEKSPLHLEGLSRLGENITFVDDDDLVERYVCSLYGHGTLSSVNAARLKMFLQKYKPTNHDSPLEQIKGIDAGMLPPCKDVLVQKLARCNYVAYLWKHANLRDPQENIQPTDHGWKEVNGIFLPVWFTGSQMPTILAETIAPEDVADGDEDGEDNDSINDADSDDNDDSDDEDEND